MISVRMESSEKDLLKITTRRVYYFSGFDPRGAGFYYKLFRAEAKKNFRENANISVGPRTRAGNLINFWNVCLHKNSVEPNRTERVETTHIILGWDDIIRWHWIKSTLKLIHAFSFIYFKIESWRVLSRSRKYFRPTYLSGTFPFAVFIFYLLNIFVLFGLSEYYLSGYLKISDFEKYGFQFLFIFFFSHFFFRIADRFGVFWLLRIYRFNILFSDEKIVNLKEREQEWVDLIITQQAEEPVDEIIFSAHSVGTLLAADVIGLLRSDERWKKIQPSRNIHIITLGQCFPFIGLFRNAKKFRKNLQEICEGKDVCWLDVTSRIDPLCFYNTHPLKNSDSSTDKKEFLQPILYSAKFFKMYESENWRIIKKNKMLLHFLYLMAPDKTSGFNLYDIIYGTEYFEKKVSAMTNGKIKN